MGIEDGTQDLDRGDDLLEDETAESSEELPDPKFDDEEEGAKGAESKDDEDDKITVPKSRLDQATKKFRERIQDLEARLEATQAQPASKPSAAEADTARLQENFDALQDKYEELLIDGEKDKARDVRRQMAELNRQIQRAEVTRLAAQSRFAAVEDIKYDQILTTYETTYPALDPSSGEYDKALVAEVAELKDAYQSKGYTPANALKKAVKLIVVPREDKPAPVGSDLRQQRAQQAREKVTKAVKGQPPSATAAGRDNTQPLSASSLLHMSQAEFAKLSEDQLSSLRGDAVE